MRNRRKLAATIPPRQRVAYSVLRLLGGVPLPGPGALVAETAAVAAEAPAPDAFAPLERRMVRGVLELSRRPVTAIMTHRADVRVDRCGGGPRCGARQAAQHAVPRLAGRPRLDRQIARRLAQGRRARALPARRALRAGQRDVRRGGHAGEHHGLRRARALQGRATGARDRRRRARRRRRRRHAHRSARSDHRRSARATPTSSPKWSNCPTARFSVDGALALPDLQERLRFDVAARWQLPDRGRIWCSPSSVACRSKATPSNGAAGSSKWLRWTG